jgi:hypothetical protein
MVGFFGLPDKLLIRPFNVETVRAQRAQGRIYKFVDSYIEYTAFVLEYIG